MNLRTSFTALRTNLASSIFLIAGLTACGASTQAATTTLVPTSYTTTAGTDGGQAVATSIAIQDLTGSKDSWNKYVEFGPKGSQAYVGYQSFTLPTSVSPNTVSAIQVKVNYRGPNTATQVWTWKIYNWATASYVNVGTNASAPGWGKWTVLNFNVSGSLANYVRTSDGKIQIGLSANNTADSTDIDYEAVIVTSGGVTVSSSSAVSSSLIASSKSSSISSVVASSSKASVASSVVAISSSKSSTPTSSSTASVVASSSKSSVVSSVVASSVVSSTPKSSSVASSSSSNGQIGANYYVAPTGSNSNNGSLSSPWKTIQYAVSKAIAGDTVNVRAGTYPEVVTITRSGSAAAGQRIIFRNYPGEHPVIDAAGKSVVDGQSGVITLNDVSYVTVDGFEAKNLTANSTSNVPVGIFITGAGSYVEILNNHIHDIKNSASGCNANALGLAVYGSKAPDSINNLTISGNELDHLTLGCSESMSINGNVQYWKVTNNIVHDNNNIGIDAIGYEGTSPNATYDQARDGLISGNTVYNITSYGNPAYGNEYAADGIYVDGGTRIVIENNIIHHTDFGIELASEHKGKSTSYITARNNLVWSNNTAGITIGGYASGTGSTDNCTIVNNTFLFNDTKKTGAGEFQIQFYANNNVVKNNIFYASSEGVFINSINNSSSNPADVDYNIYYSSVGTGNAQFTWKGTNYNGFAAYFAATGKDARSQFIDPKFISTATPDLHLQPSSPAINAGLTLDASVIGTVDFAKTARGKGSNVDVGAFVQ
jgi:hypothetical protein